MRSDNKADLEKLADRIRDSKDKALVRELLVRVQKLHRLTLAYHMFAVCVRQALGRSPPASQQVEYVA